MLSGPRSTTCSAATPRGMREVTRKRTSGAALSHSANTSLPPAALPSTASTTSKVSSRVASAAPTPAVVSSLHLPASSAATLSTRSSAVRASVASTTTTGVDSCRANSRASRVLPAPPIPVRVTSRAPPSWSRTSADSSSRRPTNALSGSSTVGGLEAMRVEGSSFTSTPLRRPRSARGSCRGSSPSNPAPSGVTTCAGSGSRQSPR